MTAADHRYNSEAQQHKSKQLEELVQSVQNSSRYRNISIDLVQRIGRQELNKRASLKEAIKETKSKLHQVAGAYFEQSAAFPAWQRSLESAYASADPEELRQVCRSAMAHHASTRERLPILDEFYLALFNILPPISSVLDIACGLNPLALPWMSLPEQVSYLAWDIFTDLAQFLNLIFPSLRIGAPGVDGRAEVKDVLALETTPAFDLALLLKTLPCLEQVDKTAGARLLKAVNAHWLVVSFPVRSLGGQSKGMPAHYTDQFLRLVDEMPWRIDRLDFSTELVFIVEKPL